MSSDARAPERIYVRNGYYVINAGMDRAWPNDVEYVKAKLYEQLQQENAELKAQLGNSEKPIGVIKHLTDPRSDNPNAVVDWQFGGDEINLPDGMKLYATPQPPAAVFEHLGYTAPCTEVYFSANHWFIDTWCAPIGKEYGNTVFLSRTTVNGEPTSEEVARASYRHTNDLVHHFLSEEGYE